MRGMKRYTKSTLSYGDCFEINKQKETEKKKQQEEALLISDDLSQQQKEPACDTTTSCDITPSVD